MRSSRRSPLCVLAAIVSLFAVAEASPARAADVPAAGPAQYGAVKQRNLKIRLADGRLLRADVYTPSDLATGQPAAGPFPTIVGFTPFGKTAAAKTASVGENGINIELVKRGYIAAVVDVPGTGGSEGRFNLFDAAEAQAGKEVITWASKLPHATGTVGMIGLSYVAVDQLFTAAAVGPGSPLKAIFPMAASVDPYRDLFVSGGAVNVASPVGLLFSYGFKRSTNPFLEVQNDFPTAAKLAAANIAQLSRFEGVVANDMLHNGTRRFDGAFWDERRPQRVLQQIVDNGVAAYLVGGLYDVFQRGEPLLYSGLQNAAAGRPVTAPMAPGQAATGKYQLLTGPWNHAEVGPGSDLTSVQLAWFDRWLKDERNGIDDTTTPLHVVEPGGQRYDTATYPLTEARVQRLWLHRERTLSGAPPTGPEPADRITYTGLGSICSRSFDQFAAGTFNKGLAKAGCLKDQRLPEAGPGETTYSTPPLAQPLQLGGPIGLTLRATSTATETLLAVSVEDVAPDGTSTHVTGGALQGSFRAVDPARSWPSTDGSWLMAHHPLTKASRVAVPRGGVVTRYDIEVRAAFATIPAGHRLRLRIAGADFPHFIPLADLPRLFGGTYGLRHDAAEPSLIDLSVRPG